MIEDDIQVEHNFSQVATKIVLRAFKRKPKLNVIRLGYWGEVLCFSRIGAIRILKWYCENGISRNMDNQLKILNSSEYIIRPPIYKLMVQTNDGHVMRTPKVDVTYLRQIRTPGTCVVPFKCSYVKKDTLLCPFD